MTNQMSRYEPLDPRVPMLLTIHDLTFLHEAPHDGRRREIERKQRDIQRRVDRSIAITVDSDFVAADLRRELAIGDRPIHVIPLGLEPAPAASPSRPACLPDDEPFLLSVGNALEHKNFHVLFDMLGRLPGRRLVIAGNMASHYGNSLRQQISRLQLESRVLLPGEVSDADRQWLYERCEAFLFPSLSEGFGFPVHRGDAGGKAGVRLAAHEPARDYGAARLLLRHVRRRLDGGDARERPRPLRGRSRVGSGGPRPCVELHLGADGSPLRRSL